jgi:hypothetical protein
MSTRAATIPPWKNLAGGIVTEFGPIGHRHLDFFALLVDAFRTGAQPFVEGGPLQFGD